MRIGAVNQSTLVTSDDFEKMIAAIYNQVNGDLCPDWERLPVSLNIFGSVQLVPAGTWPIVLVDSIEDQPQGVLGYHTEGKGGKLSGIVAAKPELDAGGQVLTGDWSVSSVFSHEVCELVVDPHCQLFASDNRGRAFSFEACDPVEGPTCTIDGVSVANYVTPAWFDPMAATHGQYDKLGLLQKHFSILNTGYCVYEDTAGMHQLNGEQFPDWRKEMKKRPTARTHKRLEGPLGPFI